MLNLALKFLIFPLVTEVSDVTVSINKKRCCFFPKMHKKHFWKRIPSFRLWTGRPLVQDLHFKEFSHNIDQISWDVFYLRNVLTSTALVSYTVNINSSLWGQEQVRQISMCEKRHFCCSRARNYLILTAELLPNLKKDLKREKSSK